MLIKTFLLNTYSTFGQRKKDEKESQLMGFDARLDYFISACLPVEDFIYRIVESFYSDYRTNISIRNGRDHSLIRSLNGNLFTLALNLSDDA